MATADAATHEFRRYSRPGRCERGEIWRDELAIARSASGRFRPRRTREIRPRPARRRVGRPDRVKATRSETAKSVLTCVVQ
jgi:hypothetical protein